MPPSSEEQLKTAALAALRTVKDPELGRDIVSLDMVKDLRVCGNAVALTVELTTPACPLRERIESDVRSALRAVKGVGEVSIKMSANVRSSQRPNAPEALKAVKNTIAVSSGKGGVGKSTVAVNLACSLAMDGAKVGIVDFDVWGPNVPIMMGVSGPPADPGDGSKTMLPHERYGVKVMSIGFFLKDPNEPVIWRGPMVHNLIQQFTATVKWGDLDYLVCDLPPGTGDVQLSLAQTTGLTGGVLVSTPQEVSLADVRKAIGMFRKVNVPILGMVENMSGFVCAHCGEKADIFGKGGAADLARSQDIPLLGEIPIDLEIRRGGDAGEPVVVARPESPTAIAFREAARKLAGVVSATTLGELGAERKKGFLDRLKGAFEGSSGGGGPAGGTTS